MPRGPTGTRRRRNAINALQFEQMCHDIRALRRAEKARQRDVYLKQNVFGWAELCEQTAVLDIQVQMQAMELRLINEDRRLMGLSPIDILPPDGGLGDMRRPEDDYRNWT